MGRDDRRRPRSSCWTSGGWRPCPGLAIFIVSLAFNLLGDGLRDALDPKRWSAFGASPRGGAPADRQNAPAASEVGE
jgi:hypothetical protein